MKLEDCAHDAKACIRCANCRWIDQNYTQSSRFSRTCPIVTKYAFDAYSGGGLLTIARALLEGRLEYGPSLLDIVYKCMLCGACDVRCKRNLDIEVQQTIEALRSKVVELGLGPLAPHKQISENVAATGNRYGHENQARTDWLPDGVEPGGKADVLYFVGCNSSFVQTRLARSTVKILQASGVTFSVLADEWCCGQPILTTGQDSAAREVVEKNLAAIEASGATTIVASCAECFQTLKVKYPRFLDKATEEMPFRVVHVTEYTKELVEQERLKLKGNGPQKVTYHDPCNLGRLSEPWKPWHGEFGKFNIPEPPREMRRGTSGVYDAPRELLRSIPGVELVELERRKEQSWCCGAGGAVKEVFKDFALWTAADRLEEAALTGADTVVTACPWCEQNLREAEGNRGGGMEIRDVIELVADAIEEGDDR